MDMAAVLIMSVLSESAAITVRVVRTLPHSLPRERFASLNTSGCSVPDFDVGESS
jgi:hypothetical protein